VVVVDDEPDVLEAIRSVLESWGCTVLGAPSGDDALARLASDPAPLDLVIADYRLAGGESGLDVVARVRRAARADTAALIVTAETGRDGLGALRRSGIAFLNKPVPPHRLRAALDHLLAAAAGG
jgi:CheY-like chemotaxis protein